MFSFKKTLKVLNVWGLVCSICISGMSDNLSSQDVCLKSTACVIPLIAFSSLCLSSMSVFTFCMQVCSLRQLLQLLKQLFVLSDLDWSYFCWHHWMAVEVWMIEQFQNCVTHTLVCHLCARVLWAHVCEFFNCWQAGLELPTTQQFKRAQATPTHLQTLFKLLQFTVQMVENGLQRFVASLVWKHHPNTHINCMDALVVHCMLVWHPVHRFLHTPFFGPACRSVWVSSHCVTCWTRSRGGRRFLNAFNVSSVNEDWECCVFLTIKPTGVSTWRLLVQLRLSMGSLLFTQSQMEPPALLKLCLPFVKQLEANCSKRGHGQKFSSRAFF